MDVLGACIPRAVFDGTGSILVVISLVFLFRKSPLYWHFSIAGLIPYFILWVSSGLYMLAGLQVSYLIFSVYGLSLWLFERRRDRGGAGFNERFWYHVGWILTLLIFVYSLALTRFDDAWDWLQCVIVALSLLANWATARKWIGSWYVWMVVNILQAVYFARIRLWGQFGLQFLLFGLSVQGVLEWKRDARGATVSDVPTP